MQMTNALRSAGFLPGGMGGMGGPIGGQPTFPAPGGHSGVPTSTDGAAANTGATPGVEAGASAGAFDPNLFSQILGIGGAGAGTGTGAGASPGANAFGGFNPFMFGYPGMGAGLGGSNPAPTSPPSNLPPPEERFQVQLQVRLIFCRKRSITDLTRLIATARYGLHKCSAERSCPAGYGWECSLGN